MRTNRGSVGAIDEEGDAVRARDEMHARRTRTRDRAVGRGAIFQANIVILPAGRGTR